MKIIITEMKNTLNSINSQLYIEKETIHKPENNSRICLKWNRKTRQNKKHDINEPWDNFKQPNIYVIGIPKRKDIRTNNFWRNNSQNFPNLTKTINP